MITHIIDMLKLAEHYENIESIAIAKGKFEYPKSNYELFKKMIKWQLKK